MNISVYFLLASAVFLITSAQEVSEGARETLAVIKEGSQKNLNDGIFENSTIVLDNGFTKGTNFIKSSEDKIMNGISSAEKILKEDPEAAKKLVEQSFSDANAEIFNSVRDYFQSFGEASALSKGLAKQGLGNASQMLQNAGFSILDGLNTGKYFFDQGIIVGGKASQVLLKAVRSAVTTGFSGGYHNIQKSIQTAYQALRDAKNTPIQGEEDGNQNCEAPTQDAEGSEAMNQINQAAREALERGADANQVERFLRVVICELGALVKVTSQGKRTMGEVRATIETDPEGAKKMYSNQAEAVKKVVHAVTARIYVILGDVALVTGNELKDEIGSAILSLEMGKVAIFLGLDEAGQILNIGAKYLGDSPMWAIDAASQSGYFAKVACIEGIVKASKLLLGVL